MMTRRLLPFPALCALALGACQPSADDANGGAIRDGRGAPAPAFDDIAPSETLRFTGTEPFWGGSVTGDALIYSTPSNPEGTQIAVRRFAGNSGLGFSGAFEGKPFDMAITRGGTVGGQCSDGMSDRRYPYSVTLQVSGGTRQGCAWTESKGFTGPE